MRLLCILIFKIMFTNKLSRKILMLTQDRKKAQGL